MNAIAPYVPVLGLAMVIVTWLLLLVRFRRDGGRWAGERRWKQALVLGCSWLAFICFLAALWLPSISRTTSFQKAHLVVLLDVSDSVQRAEGGWQGARDQALTAIEKAVQQLPPETQQQGKATVITFGAGARALPAVPLQDLPNRLRTLEQAHLAPSKGTRIAEALQQAERVLRRQSAQAAIWLVSDGNQTRGDARSAAQVLARQGVPIYITPVEGAPPPVTILAADLPRRVPAHQTTYLRAVLANSLANPVEVNIQVAPFAPQSNEQDASPPIEARQTITFGQPTAIRQPLIFDTLGLHAVDLNLSARIAEQPIAQQRRFYTQVVRPMRMVAIGGDTRWVAAVPPGKIEIRSITPDDLTEDILTNVDAVIVSAVPAERFSSQALQQLAQAVRQRGLGLMVINGDHAGQDEETETILMSYIDTPLEPLLPVSLRPRPFTPEPPPRDVVILIDASGSMEGWPLAISQAIANHLIDTFLRPQDRLTLLAFTTQAAKLMDRQPMTQDAKKQAIDLVNSIRAGGGTDPAEALALVGSTPLKECGLIFLSDGGFNPVTYRPDCRTTVFAIGQSAAAIPETLSSLADPIPVEPGFSPEDIHVPYFEPEPRDKFFEPGEFIPLGMSQFTAPKERLPVPSLPLFGNAVNYPKEDAQVIARRPKFLDPILAYREADAGYVGVFTTGFPPAWLDDPQAQDALVQWLLQLVPFVARDRYDFQIHDHGSVLDIRIQVMEGEAGLPELSGMHVSLLIGHDQLASATLTAATDMPATFVGSLHLPRRATPQHAVLVLNERGPDALPRPQRIPIALPPSPASLPSTTLTHEDFTYGTNSVLLQDLANMTGGTYQPGDSFVLFPAAGATTKHVILWPWFLVLGAFCYVLAIMIRRLVVLE